MNAPPTLATAVSNGQRVRPQQRIAFVVVLLGVLLIVACQARGGDVTIVVDGKEHNVTVREATVGEILQEAGVVVGKLDSVSPDTWQLARPGDTIVVKRGREEFIEVDENLPFARETMPNEALPAGEQRLAQKGEPGRVRITYRVFYADGVETERTEVRRQVIEEPVTEIIVVGAQGSFASVPIAGVVAYVSNGNAWIMRETSGSRRPLTSWGDLDGRVFDLSPDGRYLVFTRASDAESGTSFNSLWLITTTVIGETPVPLDLENLLYGEWSPDGQRIAYSTAEFTGGRPGWKANNDLWLASFSMQGGALKIQSASSGLALTALLSPSDEGAFSWWGINFSWAPDGRYIAYARPAQVGMIDVTLRLPIRLIEFPEYNTYSDWVWNPELSWSPDGRFIVCTVHKPGGSGVADEDSSVFDIEVVAVDRSVHARLVRNAGMWAAPSWSPGVEGSESLIAYGLAQQPHESDRSRYDLLVMDRDGSNPQRIYPPPGELGLVAPPQIAWSPAGNQMMLIRGGNLLLLDVGSGLSRQLTGDGGVSLLRWQG
jgi:hypothetical protein